MNTLSDNPLRGYFRKPGAFVKLPTKGKYYSADIVELTATGELEVYPITAMDEILLKSPDSLLNGTALEKVIQNCCPAIKNVKKMLVPDIDAVIVGMLLGTKNSIDVDQNCPACSKENTYPIDLNYVLETINFLDDNYLLEYNNELIFDIKPYTYEIKTRYIINEYEQQKIVKEFDLQQTDDITKLKGINQALERMAAMTIEMVAQSIVSISIKNQNIKVTDQNHILEFLKNIDRTFAEKIMNKVKEINDIGVKKNFDVECKHCNHQFPLEVGYDPTSFFD